MSVTVVHPTIATPASPSFPGECVQGQDCYGHELQPSSYGWNRGRKGSSSPCKMPQGQRRWIHQLSAIPKNEFLVRITISAWPSQCVTRMDHWAEMGPPFFDINITSEQWAKMEAAMASMVGTKDFDFCAEKIRPVKEMCSRILPPEAFVSSNDALAAIMGAAIDRTQHTTGSEVRKGQSPSLTLQ